MEMRNLSKELRIGNLIQYNEGGKCKVIGIHEFGVDVEFPEEVTYIEYDQFSPIKLTEEWFLKFPNIEWLSKDIFGYFHWFNGEKKYLEFVHILQNTYFYIEQKELIL